MLMREPSDGELVQTLTNLIDAFRKGTWLSVRPEPDSMSRPSRR